MPGVGSSYAIVTAVLRSCNPKNPCCSLVPLPAGTCPDASDSRAVVRTDSQRAAARAAEVVRLEAVLLAAAKCNAALREEDMALL